MLRVLALDLATVTGWALNRPGRAPLSGSERLVKGVVGDEVERALSAMYDWLNDQLTAFNPDVLIWEAPMAIGGRSQVTEELLFGLSSVAGLVGYRRNKQIRKAHVGTVRKAVLGSAYAKEKGEMKRRAEEFCRAQGWEPPDHNAADALILLEYADSLLNKRPVAMRAGVLA